MGFNKTISEILCQQVRFLTAEPLKGVQNPVDVHQRMKLQTQSHSLSPLQLAHIHLNVVLVLFPVSSRLDGLIFNVWEQKSVTLCFMVFFLKPSLAATDSEFNLEFDSV